ncbi:hypothetical protein G5B00_02595 [Parapedobacter sp. SGR-10]|uniref:hypothetical protein n=1 Tax=Parapedobacter sp. SGR-10 TaxID=2710879 RepID=UPI0013D1447C|nr:hypothetical protein [Parapedobacter sp. SGR-10]NGF55390.1 hypothetical protein [Parapedobacter sp. SGR-10]
MDWSYILKHWGCTLILAPILSQLFKEFGFGNPHEVIGLLEVMPITLAISLTLSLPTLFIYTFAYHILVRYDFKIKWIKLILIAWTIIGISITLGWLGGLLMDEIPLCYSIAAVVSGIMIRMKK